MIHSRFLYLATVLTCSLLLMSSCSSTVKPNAAASEATNVNNLAGGEQGVQPAATPTPNSGLPDFKVGEDYKTSVRIKMLKDGWVPSPTEAAELCGTGDSRCDEYPEMETCAGTGLGNCKFLWKRRLQIVAIFTVDDPFVYSGHEFQEELSESKSTALAGIYVYRSKHEYGFDSFVYELKSNNVATYKSEQEGGEGEDKTGTWASDSTAQTATVTFQAEDGKNESYVFKLKPRGLEMIKDPNQGQTYQGFAGVFFAKQ